MSETLIYTARFRRRKLRQWAASVPREIGAALVSEAFHVLLTTGDASAVKGLDFAGHVDGRRKRRTNPAGKEAQ